MVAACSPEYNWREVRPSEAGYSVMLPRKPESMTRAIQLDGIRTDMGMHGAQVGKTSFTAAVAPLPDAADATRQQALAAMRRGMVRNIRGRELSARPIQVDVVDASGQLRARIEGVEVEASGTVGEDPTRMLARFAALDDRAYQWVVLGPSIDRDQATTFLESFRVLR